MDTLKIGRMIAACRKEKGMTQAQLAEKLGVTAKTISRWENGNYMPDISMLQPLSEELGISLNELLSGERILQEEIPSEELLQKTESSLLGTLQYAATQIKKGKKKTMLIAALLIGVFILILFFLNQFLFSEIPYHEGDVEQWELLFPNHSAYEMAIGETGEPVFKDTNAALAKIKYDCSDAIKAIQEAYELPEFSKYTYQKYRYYAGLAKLLFKSDEQVMEQRQLLIDFLDILGNSYAWEELRNQQQKDEIAEAGNDTQIETETSIKVVDNTNADYEIITYEKEIDMTADGVADKIVLVINVTEEYKDITDTYKLFTAPFVGKVKLYDGACEELIWESKQISGDRLGNYQISLVTKDDKNYLLAGQTHEQMGGGSYYYRIYSFENENGGEVETESVSSTEEERDIKEYINGEWIVDETKIVDTYYISFILDYAAYRLYPNQFLREEIVPDYKEHIEKWLVDSELIIATDVMMERPNNILFSTKENPISATAYYDLVWDRMTDQTAVFQFVCPEISFPEEEWVQNLICVAVDEQIAVAKYYDAIAGGNCVLQAGSYTEKELLKEVEYAQYLYPNNVPEQHLQVENMVGDTIEISCYEIPFENGEYKKTAMVFWTYNEKTYVIFGQVAYDADVKSVVEMAEYMVAHMK